MISTSSAAEEMGFCSRCDTSRQSAQLCNS